MLKYNCILDSGMCDDNIIIIISLTSHVLAARTLATHLSIVTGSRLGAVLLYNSKGKHYSAPRLHSPISLASRAHDHALLTYIVSWYHCRERETLPFPAN